MPLDKNDYKAFCFDLVKEGVFVREGFCPGGVLCGGVLSGGVFVLIPPNYVSLLLSCFENLCV